MGRRPIPTSPASSPPDADQTAILAHAVAAAAEEGLALRIVGGNTRSFYGRPTQGEPFDVAGHRGVVAYDPSELVITVRAGTPVAEVEALLEAHGQMLAFEPPSFGPAGAIGGMVATGLSGPRRPFAGALRDFVLGARILDGRGRVLTFGGTVFKNVAGFDAFRLMAGAMGALGVILEVSLRVAPKPRAEMAVAIPSADIPARRWVSRMMGRPVPLSGAFYDGEKLHVRLSGGEAAVREAALQLGGEAQPLEVWRSIRDLTHPALAGDTLWRLSLPAGAEPTDLPEGRITWDWGGAQVWLAGDPPPAEVFAAAERFGGHATLFRGRGDQRFQPLPAPMLALHRRIKAAVDPKGVFNPGRMYEGL